MSNRTRFAYGLVSGIFAVALCSAGCQTSGRGFMKQTPQLYPNEHLRQVGNEQAQMDVSQCMAMADNYGPQKNQAKDAAVNTIGGAAAGAALGAIGGAITGSAGTGAAAGAAVGGTAGAGKTVYDAAKPKESYKGYVEACLEERGYKVYDWN